MVCPRFTCLRPVRYSVRRCCVGSLGYRLSFLSAWGFLLLSPRQLCSHTPLFPSFGIISGPPRSFPSGLSYSKCLRSLSVFPFLPLSFVFTALLPSFPCHSILFCCPHYPAPFLSLSQHLHIQRAPSGLFAPLGLNFWNLVINQASHYRLVGVTCLL